MQYMGFLYAIAPGIRELKKSSSARMELNGRFFNTQPYMAPSLEGIYLNLVEKEKYEDAARLIQPVSSSLAALGDSFFWAALKPLACLLCLIAVLSEKIWGILIVLLLYNLVHFWIMFFGFLEGYKTGPQGAFKIGKAISAQRSGTLLLLIPLLCGICVVLAPHRLDQHYLVAFPIFILSAFALYKKVNFMLVFYGFFILMLIMSIIIKI